jgi:pyruvate dehydrogenase E2 component (dihydrolipoamide acetyltransferase)
MSDVFMPRLSDTMEEGTILRWIKGDGDQVRRGDELVEIETDKAAMTYESDSEGVLQTLAAEGDTLPIGQVIARIGAAGVAASDAAGQSVDGKESTAGAVHATVDGDGARASQTAATRVPASESDPGGSGAAPGEERVKASPLARRIAREQGLDLHSLSGTGPGGRIVRADLQGSGEQAAARAPTPGVAVEGAPGPQAPPRPSPADVSTAKGTTTIVELSRTQQTIARRMAESKATIPDFSIQTEVDMEKCVKLRSALKRLTHADAPSAGQAQTGAGVPTYNDMVVKASAIALREYPHANGGYRDGRLLLNSRINVGVAVAAEGALVVPTVFDADEKSLGEIARETRSLAERVRAGTITPPELGGGTFTVSNLGMFGVRSFTAIINPPQAAILSVGALEPRPVVHDGEILARHTMIITLACDHRILYGADAAQFLARVRELLETPSALTL